MTRCDLFPPLHVMTTPPTWADVEALGRSEPIVYHAVMAVEFGRATREEALITVLFALAKTKRDVFDRLLDEVNMRNRPIVLQPEAR